VRFLVGLLVPKLGGDREIESSSYATS